MSWKRAYQARLAFRNAIWILPALGMVAGLVMIRILIAIDRSLGWDAGFPPESARALVSTLASSVFTLVVFVSSALLLAVQLASSQLTPRVIAIVFRDPVTKGLVTLFVFTFSLALALLVRIDTTVPWLTGGVVAYGFLASLVGFLILINHLGKSLRPSGVLRSVARMGRESIEGVYPRLEGDAAPTPESATNGRCGEAARTVPSTRDGVMLAFDLHGLTSLAERAGCVIELVPQVGDFVAAGDPLLRVHPGSSHVPDDSLREGVCVGDERTPDQDPAFAFRILVDIASKALSPAINDPTTAVLAIDQIHHLLRNLGCRRLDEGQVRDAAGALRLVYRTPDWEDFVQLAVTEIRLFGGQSIQVARRLRAMLEDLIRALPEHRAALLRRELAILHRSAERFFKEPEDLALADASDLQGVGGSSAPPLL
jgi:uncharacterized membrane protein